MPEWVSWLLGGGLASAMAVVFKLARDLQLLRVEQAKASAQAANFAADEAGSSTRVAGEDIFKGLMKTIVAREQAAYEMVSIVQQQLVDERKANADVRERYASMAEKEENLLRHNGQLLIQIRDQQGAHATEMKIYRGRLKTATQRLLSLGESLTATDVVPNDDLLEIDRARNKYPGL